MSASTCAPPRSITCTPSHAARELGLRRGEFDLAVRLGRIRTVPDEGGGGGRRVERTELDRLRAQDGFPETLRQRVRVVGTAEGAALMKIPAGRFTRLARLGLLVPVRFYLNRYRAVVWLYLAEELREFVAADENASLLKGRTPETLRSQVAAGVDLRARNWRGRHLGFLLRQAEDPWARAGAMAAFLSPVEVADVVRDPSERARLNRLRPASLDHSAPGSPSAHLAEELMTAHDADEIAWLRSELAQAVREARAHSPAPRPAPRHGSPTPPNPAPRLAPTHRVVSAPLPRTEPAPAARKSAPEEPRTPRGLRAWLRRRSPRPRHAEAEA
ncbi:DUF6397 family protein [Streptomyces sp. NPDC048297]|uniref:DUF6397 family protein n=1 Tax=Streptomyces sp. NPDC048297 TaxID=3365531 RepID=UPI00371C904C